MEPRTFYQESIRTVSSDHIGKVLQKATTCRPQRSSRPTSLGEISASGMGLLMPQEPRERAGFQVSWENLLTNTQYDKLT